MTLCDKQSARSAGFMIARHKTRCNAQFTQTPNTSSTPKNINNYKSGHANLTDKDDDNNDENNPKKITEMSYATTTNGSTYRNINLDSTPIQKYIMLIDTDASYNPTNININDIAANNNTVNINIPMLFSKFNSQSEQAINQITYKFEKVHPLKKIRSNNFVEYELICIDDDELGAEKSDPPLKRTAKICNCFDIKAKEIYLEMCCMNQNNTNEKTNNKTIKLFEEMKDRNEFKSNQTSEQIAITNNIDKSFNFSKGTSASVLHMKLL